MKKIFKILIIANACFISLAFILSQFEIKSVLFGVFWELLIIPSFFLQFSLSSIVLFLLLVREYKIEFFGIFNFIFSILLIISLIFV